jgi:small-conductance mechanosensitive channel
MFNQLTQHHLYLVLASSGGFALGFLLEILLLKRISTFLQHKKYKAGYFIVSSIKGLVTTWFLTLSCLIAANILHVSESLSTIVNKICFSIIVFSLAILVSRVLVKLIKLKTADSDSAQQSTSIILNIIRAIIIVIGFMLVLQVFGISITPMLTALGVGGLAVALALQDTLSNLFSGIQIVATKRIHNGDYILLDTGQEGYVEDITWRNTIIKNIHNNMIIIPNSKVSNSLITNYSFPDPELSVVLEVGVSYDSDLSFVEKITVETAKHCVSNIPGGIPSFEPIVRFHTFSDSSINFRVIFRANHYDNLSYLRHEFIKALHQKYKEVNVEIPYPIRTVVMKSNS